MTSLGRLVAGTLIVLILLLLWVYLSNVGLVR